MKIISPDFFFAPLSSRVKLIISFIYITYIFIYVLSLCRVDTPWCAIYITQLTNSYISSQFFLLLLFLWLCFSFVDQLNEFLAFGACVCVLGGGVVYVCFVLFVMWAFFMCSESVCVVVEGSCLIGLVVVCWRWLM